MAIHKTCDGVKRRDFLKSRRSRRCGPELGQLPAHGRGRRSRRANAWHVRHLHQPDRRSVAHGHVRSQAERARRIPRHVQSDQDQRGRRGVQRAPAEAGRLYADKFAILRGVSHTLGAHELGHGVRQHRQPADSVAGISGLWSGRDEGDRSPEPDRSAAVRRHSQQHAATARVPRRAVRAAEYERDRRSQASRSASVAFRWGTWFDGRRSRNAARTC